MSATAEERLCQYHVRVRGRGVNRLVYASASPHLAGEVTTRIWPCVELQWAWLGGTMPSAPDQATREPERRAA